MAWAGSAAPDASKIDNSTGFIVDIMFCCYKITPFYDVCQQICCLFGWNFSKKSYLCITVNFNNTLYGTPTFLAGAACIVDSVVSCGIFLQADA